MERATNGQSWNSLSKKINNIELGHPNVHCSTIHSSQDMEATQVSIHRGMDREEVVHICNGIVLSHKKERNNAICSNMDGPRDYQTR